MKFKIICAVVSVACVSQAATFVVTNTLASGPGSLEEAMNAATNSPGPDLISFAIPGTPPFVISPTGYLPEVHSGTTIDGTTQPGWSNNFPAVWIDGSFAGSNGIRCIYVFGSDCLVRGLRIQDYNGSAVILHNYNGLVQSNRIEGCHLISNGYYGVEIDGASNNLVGGYVVSNRNVLSGNRYAGVYIANGTGNRVAGNWIGVTATNSTVAMGGQQVGVSIVDSTNNIVLGSNSAQQVISGNGFQGIFANGASFTTIIGNRIGCDESGAVAVSNNTYGVLFIGGVSNRVGGPGAGQRNIISGNKDTGVEFSGNGHGSVVQGNFIGTTLAGSAVLPNLRGVLLNSLVSNCLVGGSSAGEANIISGNSVGGVTIQGKQNRVEGNIIGLAINASSSLGNGGDGVYVGESLNTIGGTNAGAGNIISANSRYGIWVGMGPNTVQGNVIGLDIFGNRRPNESGVYLSSTTGNLIGGTTPSARNIISGNSHIGVRVEPEASGDVIQGNYIGVSFDGLVRASNTVAGIRISASTNITIGGSVPGAGNVIAGNGWHNIELEPGTFGATIQGNLIGLGADGRTNYWSTNSLGLAGIVIAGRDVVVGGTDTNARNVISGNPGNGIYVYRATNTTILGNHIGLGGQGTNVVPNGPYFSSYGIYLDADADRSTIGGLTPAARNVIAGDYAAIYIRNAASNAIWGNYLGLTPAGNIAVTGTQYGVSHQSGFANTIGGTNMGAGNVIFGQQSGVSLVTTNSHHNFVQGNLINLDANGNLLTTNVLFGVSIVQAQSNRIGGATAAARNVIMCGNTIAGVGAGVQFFQTNTTGNIVQGNYINVGPDGVSPRKSTPNAGKGIDAFYASGNTIGGTNAGEGNIIAHCMFGILIAQNESKRNAIFGNTVYSNVWNGAPYPGIDLAPTGGADKTTPNDSVPDSDTGPNDFQNYPVITNVVSHPGSTRVRGYLASVPSKQFRIEFFYSDTTNAEGRVYLGATNITTASNGTNVFDAILNGYAPTSKYITATATDTNNNTSEFSPGTIKPGPANDTDGDGIPDYWESLYGLNPALAADATNHLDSDGVNNLNEYLSGTIPNNSNSFLRITRIATDDELKLITFPSSQFRNYDLEAIPAPTNNSAWNPILTNILGSGLNLTVGDLVNSTSEFYRVRSTFP